MGRLSALINAGVVALLVGVGVSLAIGLFVIILVAVRRNISAIPAPVIVALRGTIAVAGAPVASAVIQPILIAILARGIQAIASIVAAVTVTIPAAVAVTIPVAIAVTISVSIRVTPAIAAHFTKSALVSVAIGFSVIALTPAIVVGIKAAVVPRVPLSLLETFLERLPVVTIPLAPSPLHWNHRLCSRERSGARD